MLCRAAQQALLSSGSEVSDVAMCSVQRTLSLSCFDAPEINRGNGKKTHHFEMVFPLETSIFSVRGFPATELMTPFRLTAKLVVWQCLEPMFDLTDLDIQRKHLKLPVDFCGGAPRKWRGTPDFHHPFWTMGFSTRNTIQLVGNPHVYPLIHIIWGRIPVAGSLAEAYESSEIKCWRRIIRYYQ